MEELVTAAEIKTEMILVTLAPNGCNATVIITPVLPQLKTFCVN